MRGIIVVPYRDRAEHLARFRDAIKPYGLPLVVVEQADNLPFNRAKLFNVFAKRLGGFYDYYVFHDVDMMPVNPDYSYPEVPTHIATMCSQFHYMMPYAEYFGGVTLFNRRILRLLTATQMTFGDGEGKMMKCTGMCIRMD